jgi:hypothetical protein
MVRGLGGIGITAVTGFTKLMTAKEEAMTAVAPMAEAENLHIRNQLKQIRWTD